MRWRVYFADRWKLRGAHLRLPVIEQLAGCGPADESTQSPIGAGKGCELLRHLVHMPSTELEQGSLLVPLRQKALPDPTHTHKLSFRRPPTQCLLPTATVAMAMASVSDCGSASWPPNASQFSLAAPKVSAASTNM